MKAFMDQNFLLETPTAQKLFHEYASQVPVFRLSLSYQIRRKSLRIENFENITQVWLGGDHYKWRQMRSNGVDEYYITVVHLTVKNFRNGQKLWKRRSEIRCITGVI